MEEERVKSEEKNEVADFDIDYQSESYKSPLPYSRIKAHLIIGSSYCKMMRILIACPCSIRSAKSFSVRVGVVGYRLQGINCECGLGKALSVC